MKVVSKQPNSKLCIICGLENPIGLKASFYNMEDGSVMSKFKFREIDQSYPDRVHGGMVSTMLDEIAGRAIWYNGVNSFGVTMDMTVKYRKPINYDTYLFAKAIVISETKLFFKTKSYIMDENMNVLAEATNNFIKQPLDKLSDNHDHNELFIDVVDDVKEL